MSCCPPVPKIGVVTVNPDEPRAGPEVKRIPGESEDCYSARGGNVTETGSVGDKTEAVLDKIKQNAIVAKSDASINLAFTTTGPTTVTNWVFTPASFPGVTLNTSTGVMTGTFDTSVQKTKLTLRVQAMNGTTIIDDRTYDFSPSIYDDSSCIKLVHPLPGSTLTCTFGPRKPPAAGASSDHKGIDMAYGNRVTKDVMCAADGEVILARPGSGYGNYVMVKHLDASGKHLITTLYAHLDSIYVKVGQKVTGGQAVGKEGNTGIGSGPHLHFEVRLPNDTRVDPLPYLKGAVQIANTVTADNQPDTAAGTTTQTGGGGVTAAEVAARTSCPAYGPAYPSDGVTPTLPPAGTPTPPPSGSDPFEQAWYFTMTHEVNPKWMTTPDRSPSDPDVAAGLIETASQRQRVGYVSSPNYPGGTTKFGIAQKFNPKINVDSVGYESSRTTGYNVYWKNSTINCSNIATTSPRIAVMAFDMNYLHGAGNTKKMLAQAGVTTTETGAAELAALEAIAAARVSFLQTVSAELFKTYGKGWTRRANECLTYCKSL
jgi:murein DD-endopeptidase MepM/ murein hydrolase activator NlpD